MDYPHFKKPNDECSHQSIPLPENYTENVENGMSALGPHNGSHSFYTIA